MNSVQRGANVCHVACHRRLRAHMGAGLVIVELISPYHLVFSVDSAPSAKPKLSQIPAFSSHFLWHARPRPVEPMTPPRFKTVVVDVDAGTHVGTLRLNRPSKSNAIDGDMWTEIPRAVQWLDARSDVRVVVVCGAGKNFCAGIDVSSPDSLTSQLWQAVGMKCPGRKADALYR